MIGTNASPFHPGTASIRFHHSSGRLGGFPGTWGYVQGGMGMVSFFLCDAAREAGATVAAGVSVAKIVPGEGVLLEGGERISAPVVISNADPRTTLRLLGDAADAGWRKQVECDSNRRLHFKAERLASRIAQFPGATWRLRGSSFWADQHTTHETGVEIEMRPPVTVGCRIAFGLSFTFKASTIEPSLRRARIR